MSRQKRAKEAAVMQGLQAQVEVKRQRMTKSIAWKLALVLLHLAAFYAVCYCAADYAMRVMVPAHMSKP